MPEIKPRCPLPGSLSRGLILDGAVFSFNLLLAAPLARFVQSNRGFHPYFGLWLFAAIVFYTAGAALKRRPLQARLQAQGPPPLPTGISIILFVLAVMHCGLFLICASFGTSVLIGDPGGAASFAKKTAEAAAMVLGLLPTVMLVRAILPPKKPPADPERLGGRELAADIFLCLAIIIIMIWWDGFWAQELIRGKPGSLVFNLVLLVLATVPFSIFYLAPRFLFLLEDWRYPATWVRAFLVMLPLARRIIS